LQRDRRRAFAALAGLVLVFWTIAWSDGDALATERPDFKRGTVSLDRGDGTIITFDVEWAVTPRQHAYGLMHVTALQRTAGMVFVFGGDRQRSFWMKNTLIPLDILFFDGEGRFVSAAENAEPLSLEPRLSDGPARYVLEINGGLLREMGISRTARLVLPLSFVP